MFEPKRITDAQGRVIERWVLMDWNQFGITCAFLPLLWWWAAAQLQCALDDGRWWQGAATSTAVAVLLTLSAILMLGGRYWVLEVDDQGVRLLHRAEVKWRVEWAEVQAWQPEVFRKCVVALRVVDHQGSEQRLPLGRYRPWGQWGQTILESIGGQAIGTERREALVTPALARLEWHILFVLLLSAITVVVYQFWQAYHGC